MLPFVPNVTVGCVLSIFVTVRLATLVESDPWFVLSILLAYIVLFVFYLDNTAPNTTAPTATSTTNSIVVTSAQTDSNSGINASTRQYSIKKKSDSSWGSWITDSSNTHTFTNLTLNTEYQVRNQVKDAAGNGYAISATKTITTVNITKPTITLSTTSPTNKSITATITYPNITGITKQYSYDNKTWTKYTTALTIDTNKKIYARSIDSTNQGSDSTRVASLSVTNIDKTPPTVTHTIKNKKAKSVDIVIKATDKLATLVESDPWFVLSILLAYIVLFVSIVNAVVYFVQVLLS